MHFNIELDITPEEVRRLMGLPDVQAFHAELFKQMRAQMEAGAEGYDPKTLMRPFMDQAAASMDMFQKMFGGFVGATVKKDNYT